MARTSTEELLKRHNCKTLTIKDGSRFILVGGTHPTALGGSAWKHYLRVKDFFDVLDYDVIAMEGPIVPKSDLDFEIKVLKEMAARIREDPALWSELDNLFAKSSLDNDFKKLLTYEEKSLIMDFRYVKRILKKIEKEGGISLESREKLSRIAEEHLRSYLVPYERGRYDQKQVEEVLSTANQSGNFTAILMSKAIKKGVDFAVCDVEEPSLIFGLLQVFLIGGLAYFTSPLILVGYSLLFLMSSMLLPASSGAFLHKKYGKGINKLSRSIVAVSNIALYTAWRYRETVVALQLLHLAERFKSTHKNRPGTFLYFSHAGHTNGIFENLHLGADGLRCRLNSKQFTVYRAFYHECLFLETGKLDGKEHAKYLKMAEERGVPIGEV